MDFFDVFHTQSFIPLFTTERMRGLDEATKTQLSQQKKYKKDKIGAGYSLMQEAGQALFELVQAEGKSPVAILVGGGNNGGDGLVLARKLVEAGISCTVYSLVPEDQFKNEAQRALDDFLEAGGQLTPFVSVKGKDRKPTEVFKLAVDCLLGIGATGDLRSAYADAVRTVSSWGVPIIAADAPTGYDSREHRRREPCLRAQTTLQFGFPRLDAYVREGGEVFGIPRFAKLSYPDPQVQNFDERLYLATEDFIPKMLPPRDEWGDKRSQGCALIIAGSRNMPGAAALCTSAALRSGAGLVTLASPVDAMPALMSKLTESVFIELPHPEGSDDDFTGTIHTSHVGTLLEKAKHHQALAIGPGLSMTEETCTAVLDFLSKAEATPLVIDADALNAIASLNKDEKDVSETRSNFEASAFLRNIKTSAIITPHVREFERLFGKLPENSSMIPQALKTIAMNTNKVILLKGAPTFVADPNGSVAVIPGANSGLAKGGSGDVLTGIIVALLAQGLSTIEAAILAALIHQKAGRITRESLGAYSMQPTDIIQNLHLAFQQ